MKAEESHELLFHIDQEEESGFGAARAEIENGRNWWYKAVTYQNTVTIFNIWLAKKLGDLWGRIKDNQIHWRLCLECTLCFSAIIFYLLTRQSSAGLSTSKSPFTGAFARFPRISDLPTRQRRITIIGVWNDDSFTTFLRHFFYTIQLNADVLDLVMINRKRQLDSKCLDFDKEKIDITWGGNIRFYCMNNTEWNRRHVDFLCSAKYGWNCNSTEREEVWNEFSHREDPKNYNWRPLRGYAFHDLFPNPENPFWGWLDHDLFVGNFARYPFNILSQLSILTGTQKMADYIYMAGQLTVFNLDDEALATAWKRFPPMKTAHHFTRYIEGKMPQSAEERYWSYGYLRSNDGLPGTNLSYCIYPDIHGDDFYNGIWNEQNSNQTYLISGRDILLAPVSYSRKSIETLFSIERAEPIDDLGSIGWTGGQDGSQYLIDGSTLDASTAKSLAIAAARRSDRSISIHNGIVEDIILLQNTSCTINPTWKQCIFRNPLTEVKPSIMRSSLLHFKEQQPNHLLRRLELDERSRAYERKLLKHHLFSKKLAWFELPNFEIAEDMVLKYNSDAIEVFRMGSDRDKTVFYRGKGEKSIG